MRDTAISLAVFSTPIAMPMALTAMPMSIFMPMSMSMIICTRKWTPRIFMMMSWENTVSPTITVGTRIRTRILTRLTSSEGGD